MRCLNFIVAKMVHYAAMYYILYAFEDLEHDKSLRHRFVICSLVSFVFLDY